MAISTFCLGCRSLLRLPDDLAGKQVRCQKCNQLFMVPGVLASGPGKPAAPSVKPQPRPEPMAVAPPVPPPNVAPPPKPAPRVTPPSPMPHAQSASPADGVPAVVLVEVPTRPTPPPLEESKPSHSGRPEPAAPARRAIPPMNLSGRERPRRTNRPRRPTSVLAGLTLTVMALLFVGLLFASGGTWMWASISRPQINNNGPFVQQPPQPFFPPNGGPMIGQPPFPPKGGQFGQPPPFPPFVLRDGGLQGAVGEGAVFNPGPPGPRFKGKTTTVTLNNGVAVVKAELLKDDQLDTVQRPPFQTLPCRVFLVTMEANKRYFVDYSCGKQINMPNNPAAVQAIPDPYLRIEDEDGQRLVEHDDLVSQQVGQGDMNSRIEFIPQKTGTYRVFCTLFQFPPQKPSLPFTLTIREDNRPLPQSRALNQPLVRTSVTKGDPNIIALANPGNAQPVGDVCWSPDRRAFFVLYKNGTLKRVALDGFVEQRRLELGHDPGNASMTMSAQGLVLGIPGIPARNEVWLIDPDTLQIKKRYGAFPPLAVASAPGLNFAYVATQTQSRQGLYLLDLAKDTPIRFISVPNQEPVVSPNGTSLFSMNDDFLISFEVKADGVLVQKQFVGPMGILGNNPRRINVSPDSKHVCVSGASFQMNLPNHPNVGQAPAYVYLVDGDLRKPAFGISTGIPLRGLGFDGANRIFTHAAGGSLVMFFGAGQNRREIAVPGEAQEPLQLLTHADGTVLIRYAAKICCMVKPEVAPVVKADPPFPQPTPIKDAETFALAPLDRGKVTYRDLQLPNFGKIEPCWDADGQALFHLEADGTLTRIRANDFVPQTSLSLGKPVSAMAVSARGLLVALRDQPEVWVIDARDLKVLRRIICTSPATHLASHPKLSVAAAVGAEAMLLDLTFRNAPRGLPVKPVADQPFQNPALTSDGVYLFLCQAGAGSSKVLRIRIDKDPPVLEESRDTPVKAAHAFCIHGDHVAWYSSLKNKKQETDFYKVGDWNAPAFTVPERARAMASASDGSLYVQTHDNIKMLKVFAQPHKQDAAPVTLPWQDGRIREFVPHPQQPRRFLASTDKTVFHGEVVVP